MPVPKESIIRAEVDKSKASDFWIEHVTPITKDNLKYGTGSIEHLSKTALTKPQEEDIKEVARFKFGKYKGKSYKWVEENDESYWTWAQENIKNL